MGGHPTILVSSGGTGDESHLGGWPFLVALRGGCGVFFRQTSPWWDKSNFDLNMTKGPQRHPGVSAADPVLSPVTGCSARTTVHRFRALESINLRAPVRVLPRRI